LYVFFSLLFDYFCCFKMMSLELGVSVEVMSE